MIKLYIVLASMVSLGIYIYLWHYKPLADAQDSVKVLKQEVIKQKNTTFEEVYKERKKHIIKDTYEKNITHDYSIGKHTLTI